MLRRFLRDRRGNFGVLFAIMVLPVLAVMGAAVDYSRIRHAQNQLQSAGDAALLASVREAHDPSSLLYLAREYAGMNIEGMPFEAAIDIEPGKVGLTLTSRLDLPFLAAAGKPEARLEIYSQVKTTRDFSSGGAQLAGFEDIRRELRQQVVDKLPPRHHDAMFRFVDERLEEIETTHPGHTALSR